MCESAEIMVRAMLASSVALFTSIVAGQQGRRGAGARLEKSSEAENPANAGAVHSRVTGVTPRSHRDEVHIRVTDRFSVDKRSRVRVTVGRVVPLTGGVFGGE